MDKDLQMSILNYFIQPSMNVRKCHTYLGSCMVAYFILKFCEHFLTSGPCLYMTFSVEMSTFCIEMQEYLCSGQMQHPLLYPSKVVHLYLISNLQWINTLSERVVLVWHFLA